MSKYQDAINELREDALVSGMPRYLELVDIMEELQSQYIHRITDAELLNELRKLTGTLGDLDLKTKINNLINKEKLIKSELTMLCKRISTDDMSKNQLEREIRKLNGKIY